MKTKIAFGLSLLLAGFGCDSTDTADGGVFTTIEAGSSGG